MKSILFLFFVIFAPLQIAIAQAPDAENLPLHIIFHKNEMGGSGWSPDGKTFITYSASERATKLWDLQTEKVIWEVSLDDGQDIETISKSQSFAWSRNRKLIAVSDDRGKLFVLDSSDGKKLWKTGARRENLDQMRFVLDDKFIVVAAGGENEKPTVELWNVAAGKMEKKFDVGLEVLTAISFDKAGKVLKVGGLNGKVIYLDADAGKIVKNVDLKPCGALKNTFSNNTQFSPNLNYMVARCRDKTVITSVATGKVVRVLKMKADFEKVIGFSGDENTLVLEDLSGYKIFKFAGGVVKDIDDLEIWYGVDLTYDGSLLLESTDFRNRGLAIAEVNTGRVIKNFESHPGEIINLVFNRDGSRFASASADGVVRVWDTATRRLIWAKFANDRGTNAVAFSPNGKFLLSGGDNESDVNPIKVWNAENGELLREIADENDGTDGVKQIKFSPDGKLFLTTSGALAFRLWSTESWQVWREFRTNEEHRSGNMNWCCGSKALSVSFDKSGARILSAHEDGTVKIWTIDGREPVKVFQPSENPVRAYLSPDEKRILVTNAYTGITKLIDAENGNSIREYKTGDPDRELDYVTDAAFSAGGERFLTTSWFDDVMLWEASSGKLLKRANVGWSTEDELEMSPDGKYFLAGGENQNIMLFNAENSELVWSLFPVNTELRRIHEADEAARRAFVKWREDYAARADADNRERVKKITVRFSHYGAAESFWDQKIAESGAPDKSRMILPKEKASVAWFTLTNDADLAILIDTNSIIFNRKCKGLCDGAEISSRYVMELENGETRVNGFDMYSKTILPPRTTVYFSVSLEHFSESKTIYLSFTFQKDNPDDKDSDNFGTEQKLYLPRRADLPQ